MIDEMIALIGTDLPQATRICKDRTWHWASSRASGRERTGTGAESSGERGRTAWGKCGQGSGRNKAASTR